MKEKDSYILTVAGYLDRTLVIPRRIRISAYTGKNPPNISGASVDPAWREAAEVACQAAMTLTGIYDREIRINLDPGPMLTGHSASVTVGLLATLALMEIDTIPPFFATGHLDLDGYLQGGAGLKRKADAVTSWKRQGSIVDRPFLAPPVWPIPIKDAPSIRTCSDLGSALSIICPKAYSTVRENHLGLARRNGKSAGKTSKWIHITGPRDSIMPRPSRGISLSTNNVADRVENGDQIQLFVGEGPFCLWSTSMRKNSVPPDVWSNIISGVAASFNVAGIAIGQKP